MALLLGLDIGTSATKAILIDESGAVRASADSPHSVQMPRPGWSEQDPDEWWTAACRATRAAMAKANATGADVKAVGFSGQMHGSVFLGGNPDAGNPRPIRPAMLWNDQRTGAQCESIERAAGGRDALVRITGNPALTGFTLPKVLWLKEHEPHHFERLRHLLLPKDYVRFRLTGELAIDIGDASGVGLLDLRARAWHAQLTRALGLSPAILPTIVESSASIGTVSRHAAELTGLRAGTVVAAGSGDQMAGAVGMGIVSPGLVSATLGTSGVIFAHAGPNVPRDLGGRVQIMCSAVPGEYCVYGCMLSAAGAMQWFHDALLPNESFAVLDAEAAKCDAGAEGLIFLPYLTGERCPHPDPLARGAFIGLTARHTRAHMIRAILEGVAFGMADMLDLVRSMHITPSEIRLGGGGAKSILWREIQANSYATPITLLNTSEGSAYGAALLGGVAAGLWSNVPEACRACLNERSRLTPDPAAVARHAELRRVFDSLYPVLRGTFADLSRLAGRT